MTVEELIAALLHYPQDAVVLWRVKGVNMNQGDVLYIDEVELDLDGNVVLS